MIIPKKKHCRFEKSRGLLSVSAFLIFSINLSCSSAKDTIVSGDYISREYLKKIRSTLSPLAASKLGLVQLMKVSLEEKKTFLQAIYDFNEGGPKYQVINTDSLLLVEGVDSNPSFQIKNSSTIEFGFETHSKKTFIYSPTLEKSINSICLSGEYTNSKHEKLRFDQNGFWSLRKKTESYHVGVFFPPGFNVDYFMADSGEIGFKRKGDTLVLYPTVGGSLFEGGKLDMSKPESFVILGQ
jgi:hypothetical protein